MHDEEYSIYSSSFSSLDHQTPKAHTYFTCFPYTSYAYNLVTSFDNKKILLYLSVQCNALFLVFV